MTFEEWQVAEPKTFAVFIEVAEGDLEMVRRTYAEGNTRHQKFKAEWQALIDICGPQPFIDNAMKQTQRVEPWHTALALAVGRAAPNKGKLK